MRICRLRKNNNTKKKNSSNTATNRSENVLTHISWMVWKTAVNEIHIVRSKIKRVNLPNISDSSSLGVITAQRALGALEYSTING